MRDLVPHVFSEVKDMSKYNEMIIHMETLGYAEKRQFLQYLVQMAERARHQFSVDDKTALLSYAYEEAERMLRAIPEAGSYKEKDLIFECEDFLLGLVMHLSGSSGNIPDDKLIKLKALAELVDKERYIERTLDSVFSQDAISEADINRLLYWVRSSTDEYQKSKLFLGLAHYSQDISKFNDGAKQLMTDYLVSELYRLMKLDTADAWNTLELLADVCKHFGCDRVVAALTDLLQLGHHHINFYAVDSLFTLGADVPQSVIHALAQDLEYANLTYGVLQRCGKTELFPENCTTEEYLAKSDLVHWLTFPTELGKVPDEIVYIGRIKLLFKKEEFHVFKFRSDSDTLDDGLKNKWLIGWSSNEGGTFINFDEYALFEKATIDATLKNIKKKLIG